MDTLQPGVKENKSVEGGGEHMYGKCEDGAEIKCANCGGAHVWPMGEK